MWLAGASRNVHEKGQQQEGTRKGSLSSPLIPGG